MATPPSNKRSLDVDNDSSPPAQRVRLMATPSANPLPAYTQETPGPSRSPPPTPTTPRFIPIRGTFSNPPPPPSSGLNSRRLLHPSYFNNMLDDVQRRYNAFPVRGNPDPDFLTIIDDIEKKFKSEYGPNVFLSLEHIRFGDDWLKCKLSEKLMNIIMAIENAHELTTRSCEKVKAVDRVARYWKRLAVMFPKEEEEEKEEAEAEAEVAGQVEIQEDDEVDMEADDEDEIEDDESDDEGSLDDDTDIEDELVARATGA